MCRAGRWLVCVLVCALCPASGRTRAAADSVAEIRAEALNRSRVMEWMRALTAAPRVTGSPALDDAARWAENQLKALGLANVHLERWPFERRWSVVGVTLEVVEPETLALAAIPQTWSPGTKGVEAGPLRAVRVTNKGTIAAESMGRMKGAFALVDGGDSLSADAQNRLQELLASEGVIATLERSIGPDAKVVYARTGHTPEQDGRQLLVPSLAVRQDDFQRLEQLVKKSSSVVIRGNVSVVDERGDPQAGLSVIADLVGSNSSLPPVLLGAHLDSVHAAQGATDNAAGCSILIEAMRAIATANAVTRRTIRIALWGGEEQGRRGSKAYLQAHGRELPAAYFNMDRGGGRITGMIIEGGDLAGEARRWAQRLFTDGVRTIESVATAGSDHVTFRDAGVPTFTFWQDMRSYASTHHSTGDTLAAVRDPDLRQAAVVVAIAAYLAAQ